MESLCGILSILAMKMELLMYSTLMEKPDHSTSLIYIHFKLSVSKFPLVQGLVKVHAHLKLKFKQLKLVSLRVLTKVHFLFCIRVLSYIDQNLIKFLDSQVLQK